MTQNGFYEYAFINQSSGTSSSTAVINQGSASYNDAAGITQNSGYGNWARIDQNGSNESAIITQGGLETNNAYIYQDELSNTENATIGQSNSSNWGSINQYGSNDIASINQSGDGNTAVIVQLAGGSNNQANVNQYNGGNQAYVYQSGTGKVINVVQNSGSYASITQ